jgi:hypothetical protein
MNQLDQILTAIAREHLGIPTLGTSNSDALDFYDLPVWGIRAAILHAYQAGVNASSENTRFIDKELTSNAMFHTPGLFRALQNDYRINGKPRLHAIETLSYGYGLSRDEAAGLLSGAIKSEIDDAAGTVTFTSRCDESPASSDPVQNPYSVLLLYPDCVNDSGNETYYAFVQALDPGEAIATAQRQAVAAQEGIEIEPDDFIPLLVTPGHNYSEPLFNK